MAIKLNWNNNMSVGIETIDNQHKKLVEAINGFYDGINRKSNKEEMLELLKKMKEYSHLHFGYEEGLLKKHGYTLFENHLKEHKSFIEKIEDIENRLKLGKLVISIELTSFLNSWLNNHILVADKKYSSFLLSKGVK
jgi:hemerythrin